MATNLIFWSSEGLRGIFLHRFTSIVTIMGLGFSLWTFGFVLQLWTNLQKYKESLLSGIQMEVFLDVNEPAARHNSIGEHIAALDGIIGIEYISKERAAEIFAREFGSDLFEIIKDNPLPASFKVSVKPELLDNNRVKSIQSKIESIAGIDEVLFHGDLIQTIRFRFNTISRIMGTSGCLILFGAMMIFLQGIRISIRERRAFINSLLLTGAKFSTIRLPFILEGFYVGILAGVGAFTLLFLSTIIMDKYIVDFSFSNLLVVIIPAGIFLGLVGSVIAANKNLKGFLNLK